jgi:hypothetical protein
MSDRTSLPWRQSSRCSSGGCVQVAQTGPEVRVRNSTDPGGPELAVAAAAWRDFLDGIKHGDFADPPQE